MRFVHGGGVCVWGGGACRVRGVTGSVVFTLHNPLPGSGDCDSHFGVAVWARGAARIAKAKLPELGV